MKASPAPRPILTTLLALSLSAAPCLHATTWSTDDSDPNPGIWIGVGETGSLDLLSGDAILLNPDTKVHRLWIGVSNADGGGHGTLTIHNGSQITVNNASADSQYGTVVVGHNADGATGGVGVVHQNGGSVNLNFSALNIGIYGATGTYHLSGGTLNLGSEDDIASLFLGNGVGASGTLNLSGSAAFLQGSADGAIGDGAQTFLGYAGGTAHIRQSDTSVARFKGYQSNGSTAFWVGGNTSAGEGTYDLVDGTLSFDLLNIRWGYQGKGTLNQSNGTQTVSATSTVTIGSAGGEGAFNLSGGTATFETGIRLTDNSTSIGTLHLSGNGVLELGGGATGLTHGGGDGTLLLDGGTLRVINTDLTSAARATLGTNARTTFATNGYNAIFARGLEGDGGFIKSDTGILAFNDTSTLRAGSEIRSGIVAVGYGSGNTGNMTLDEGAELLLEITGANVNRLQIGIAGGNGTFTIADGSIVVDNAAATTGWGTIDVGRGTGSTGTLNHATGTINMGGGAFQVGVEGGDGTYHLGGEGQLLLGSGSTVYFGASNTGAKATINITGNAKLLQGEAESSGGQNYIGVDGGEAEITQNGNTEVRFKGNGPNSAFWVGGFNSAGVGNYRLQSGSLTFDPLNIRWGNRGEGTLTQSGGTLVVNAGSSLTFGTEGGTGLFELTSGTATLHTQLRLAQGATSTGTLRLSGDGILEIGGTDGIIEGGGSASVELGGGTVRVIGSDFSTSVALTLTASGNTTIDTNGLRATFHGLLHGSGDLTKTGSGTLILNGTSLQSGTTFVNAGTLQVDGESGAVSVTSGGTLSGTGVIQGAAVIAGALNPGNSPGHLSFTEGLTLADGSTTTLELTATAHDSISITGGDFLIESDADLVFSLGHLGTTSRTVTVFDFATGSGTFDSVTLEGVYGSFALTLSGESFWSLDAPTSHLLAFTFDGATGEVFYEAVPEPGVGLLLLLAGAGLHLHARSRQRRR